MFEKKLVKVTRAITTLFYSFQVIIPWLQSKKWIAKGQIILVSSISSKNERKLVEFRYHSSKVEFFRSFFGWNRRHKKPFRNHLTFKNEKKYHHWTEEMFSKEGLISETFSILVSNHYPDHYPPNEKMIKIVIWNLFLKFEPSWKNFLRLSHLCLSYLYCIAFRTNAFVSCKH